MAEREALSDKSVTATKYPAGFVVLDSQPTDEQLRRIEESKKERAKEELKKNVENLQQDLFSRIDTVLDEADLNYKRMIGDEEPFERMVTQEPSDFIAQHILTGEGLRVVLDVANIGLSTTARPNVDPITGKNTLDVQAIEIAIDFFLALGVRVIAFLPAAFVKQRLVLAKCAAKKNNASHSYESNACMVTDDWERLFGLVAARIITLVPAGADDDLYILHYAKRHCCFIVSNDFYADHIKRLECTHGRPLAAGLRLWIETNRSSFAFVHEQRLETQLVMSHSYQFMLTPTSALSLAMERVQQHGLPAPSSAPTQGIASTSKGNANALASSHRMAGIVQSMEQVSRAVQQLVQEYDNALTTMQHSCGTGEQNSTRGQVMSVIWEECNAVARYMEAEMDGNKERLRRLLIQLEQHAML